MNTAYLARSANDPGLEVDTDNVLTEELILILDSSGTCSDELFLLRRAEIYINRTQGPMG